MSAEGARVRCEICGGSLGEPRPAGRLGPFALARCGACGWEALTPIPSWGEIRSLYDAHYYRAWGMAEGEDPAIATMKRATFALRMDELAPYVQGGRLLDVGTASGFLLEVARARGFDPYGIELSPYAGALAAAKFGADRVHIGTLETAPFEPASFDVVTLCDFLEHVVEPVATLAGVAALLRPGGILLIMTPDTGSLSRRLMGRRWTHYKVEHLSYFDRRSIAAAGARTGFVMERFVPCRKMLRLRYLRTQLRTYPHRVLTPLADLLGGMLPFLLDLDVRLTIGEFVAIFRKPAAAAPR